MTFRNYSCRPWFILVSKLATFAEVPYLSKMDIWPRDEIRRDPSRLTALRTLTRIKYSTLLKVRIVAAVMRRTSSVGQAIGSSAMMRLDGEKFNGRRRFSKPTPI